MNAIKRLAQIERARAERIGRATRHEAGQIGLALDHFLRRMPVRPFRHLADALGARPGEPFAADADAVAHGLAVAEHEVEIGIGRVDDDGAGGLPGLEGHDLAPELRRQFLRLAFLGLLLRRQGCNRGAAIDGGRRVVRTRIDVAGRARAARTVVEHVAGLSRGAVAIGTGRRLVDGGALVGALAHPGVVGRGGEIGAGSRRGERLALAAGLVRTGLRLARIGRLELPAQIGRRRRRRIDIRVVGVLDRHGWAHADRFAGSRRVILCLCGARNGENGRHGDPNGGGARRCHVKSHYPRLLLV